MTLLMSLKNNEKRVGVKQLPCGPPVEISDFSESLLYTETRNFLLASNWLINSNRYQFNLNFLSLKRILLWDV